MQQQQVVMYNSTTTLFTDTTTQFTDTVSSAQRLHANNGTYIQCAEDTAEPTAALILLQTMSLF